MRLLTYLCSKRALLLFNPQQTREHPLIKEESINKALIQIYVLAKYTANYLVNVIIEMCWIFNDF